MLDERMHNYPQGYKEKPWCPNTPLVQICLELAGITKSPESFCYEKMSNARYSGGAIHWLESADYEPRASCSDAAQELSAQIKFVEDPNAINNISNIYEGIAIHMLAKKAESGIDVKGEIINRWRKVVFKNCVCTTADEKNHHFRQFESADQLSDDEVINDVKNLEDALSKIIRHDKDTFAWDLGYVGGCPQAPRSGHIGRYED